MKNIKPNPYPPGRSDRYDPQPDNGILPYPPGSIYAPKHNDKPYSVKGKPNVKPTRTRLRTILDGIHAQPTQAALNAYTKRNSVAIAFMPPQDRQRIQAAVAVRRAILNARATGQKARAIYCPTTR